MSATMRWLLIGWLATLAAAAQPLEPEDPRLRQIDSPGLTVELRVGLAGRRHDRLPTPIVVSARNRTGRPLDATLELEQVVPGAGGRRGLHGLPLFLAPGARLRRYLALAMSDDALSVRLRVGGTIVWQRGVDLNSGTLGSLLEDETIDVLAVHPTQARRRFAVAREAGSSRSSTTVRRGRPSVAGQRAVLSHSLETWELPHTIAPLAAFHALVFVPAAVSEPPDASQLRAVAEYLRQGGSVVVPRAAEALLEALHAALPAGYPSLRPPPGDATALRSMRVGAGQLLWAGDALYAGDHAALIAHLDGLDEPMFPRYLGLNYWHSSGPSPNASISLLQVAGLFGLYTLLTGPVVLLLLRRRKRTLVRAYVLAVVLLFCVLSALLGPTLSLRQGDARWVTVTELTPHGGVQWGVALLGSAGGRQHAATLAGGHVDSWLLPADALARGRYGFMRWDYDSHPLPARMDVLGDRPAVEHARIPIAPWGTRLLLATAHWPAGRELTARVLLTDDGDLVARGRNALPVTLRDATLVLGAWTAARVSPRSNVRSRGGELRYQRIRLGRLAPGQPWRVRTALALGYRHHLGYYGGVSPTLPRITQQGRLYGWLVCDVDDSPALRLTGDDFATHGGRHVLIQRLRPDQLPAPEDVIVAPNAEDEDD